MPELFGSSRSWSVLKLIGLLVSGHMKNGLTYFLSMFLCKIELCFYIHIFLNISEVYQITVFYCCQTATAFWWIHNHSLSDNTCHCRWGLRVVSKWHCKLSWINTGIYDMVFCYSYRKDGGILPLLTLSVLLNHLSQFPGSFMPAMWSGLLYRDSFSTAHNSHAC